MLQKLVSGAFVASIGCFFIVCALGFSWMFWWLVTALFMGGPRHLFNSSIEGADRFIYHIALVVLMVTPVAFFGWLEDTLCKKDDDDDE